MSRLDLLSEAEVRGLSRLTQTSSVEFDDLTDLPNMLYFRRYAPAYVERAALRHASCYLIYFNLENFSGFNERYGFEEGDRLLQLTAVSLGEAFPGYLLSRISGDRFLLVCESRDPRRAILSARDQLHAFGRNANVELKAGIYEIREAGIDIGVACDRAKVAADSISHRYDKVFRTFDADLSWYEERRHYIENNIDAAIEGGWIKVFYQPIVRSVTGEVCEFEALSRWRDPHYGMLSPAVFIDVLERAHLIHKLDACVIEQVCANWSDYRGSHPWRVPVSVNLSRLDFELCDVFEMVTDLTRKYHVPHQMLHIEITESAINESSTLLAKEVVRFREANFQVWLDDFGSGYSSLNTLKDHVFDVVKIDMAFLREFDTKPQSRVIIASVVNMAKQLGMQTLIEGVETNEQFEFLRGIGCEFCQGYLIGRPEEPEKNIERILAGEITMENFSLHGYYDHLGRINSLSATPFEFPWDTSSTERPVAEMLPLAIIERIAGNWHILSSNDAFSEELAGVVDITPAVMFERVNSRYDRAAASIADTIQRASVTNAIETVDVLVNGKHCMVRCRYISSHESTCAVLVSLINLSRLSDISEERTLKVALRYLYALYDHVCLVDLVDGTVSTIYQGNSAYPAFRQGMSADDALSRFARDFVHPEDQTRYLRFVNAQTVDERVIAAGKGHLSDSFRIKDSDGLFEWSTVEVVPIRIDGDDSVLLCTRPTSKEAIDTVTGAGEISKALLWDTLLNLVPAGVFWKDKNRRFVGVNKNFLDFYEFESVDDVYGKTDEDMGWHVDEGPFMSDELRVIKLGEPVIGARGTCMAHGEVRRILASKIPLLRGGEVVGLLGYFTDRPDTDLDERSLMEDGFERMDRTDRLTNIANREGFVFSAHAFEEAYVRNGTDFCCLSIDICDMGGLNEVYGHVFGNRILTCVARALERACGVSGVVARTGGDKFNALFRVEGVPYAEAEVVRLVDAIESVTDVDGITVHLRCSYGWALYSEVEDLLGLVRLADERRQAATGCVD